MYQDTRGWSEGMAEAYALGLSDGRRGACPPEWHRKHSDYRGRFEDGVPSVLDSEPGAGTILRAALPEGCGFAACYVQGYRHGWASRATNNEEN